MVKVFQARLRQPHLWRSRIWLTSLLMLFARASCCAAPDEGYTLIARALHAKTSLVYTGRQDIVWTCANGDMAEIVTDIARAGRRSRITYCYPAEALGRILVDDGAQTSLYEPSRRVILIGQSLSGETELETAPMLSLLHANYCCRRVRYEWLGSFCCDVVAITPRCQPGPSKMCWIERVHHAILRTEEYDFQGNRQYVSSYETICFPARLPMSALSLPLDALRAQKHRAEARPVALTAVPQAFRAIGIAGTLPAWLPRGYALLQCARIRSSQGRPALLLRYGDGLKTITVQEEAPGPGANLAEMNRNLSQYGQQAWMETRPAGRFIVRGDLSLSRALGAEMLAALAPEAERCLVHQLAQDFGEAVVNSAHSLRRRGWSYEQIAALALLGQRNEQRARRIRKMLARGASWPKVISALPSDAAKRDELEARARVWVHSALAARRGELRTYAQ